VLEFEEAVSCYEHVLGLLEAGAPVAAEIRSQILVSLAAAQHEAGGVETSKQTLRHALESARGTGNAVAIAEATELGKRFAAEDP
jgi:hypothetical protein